MRINKMIITMIVAGILAACGTPAALPPTGTPVSPTDTPVPPTQTPTPIATSPTPVIKGKVDVGGYRLNIQCKGEGSPSIVVDVGWGGDMTYLLSLYTNIPEDLGVRVCVYDRVGRGQSDPAPYEPRTNVDMAQDLHQLLYNANITGPYVLVAHDMAGYNARLFADRYPADVAGMVLVDALHPDWNSRVLALFPPESGDEPEGVKGFRVFYTEKVNDPLSVTENWNIPDSEEQVRASGDLGDIPLVVMTRDTTQPKLQLPNYEMDYGDFPLELAAKMDEIWLELQRDLATLSTNSTHTIVENTNHMLPRQNPESVLDAIRWVLAGGKTDKPDIPSGTPVGFGRVVVDGRNVYLMCEGDGSPTIVLDVGIQYAAFYASHVWLPTITKLKADLANRICTYERPGIMMSDPLPEKAARTSRDMAEDLHALLHNANIPEPYVLVTLFTANFSAHLYAQQYPGELLGMVWVTPMHVDEIPSIVSLIPPEAPDEGEAIKLYRQFYVTLAEDPLNSREYWDYTASAEQVRAADILGTMPLVVLTRDGNNPQKQLNFYTEMIGSDFPGGFINELDRQILPLKQETAELSANSKLVVIEDTSDLLPYEKPEVVVEAIRWVLETAGSD